MTSSNNNDKILEELSKINESLSSINIIQPENKNIEINSNEKSIINNNDIQSYSSLNEIININKGIDSIYDNLQLIKGNKINCKILYNINNYTQTSEDNL